MITVNITDTARPGLKALMARTENPIPGLLIAARAVGNLLKAHWREKDKTANKLGGERTHFWLGIGQGVNAPQQTAKDTVTVSVGGSAGSQLLQKIYGGVIRAKKAGALTIPLRPEAHGRSASVLERTLGIKLFAVKGVLAAKGANGELIAYYALKKSVNQRADGTALPGEDRIREVAEGAFFGWLENK